MSPTDLLGFDPARLFREIVELLNAPTTNLRASGLLLAVIVILVSILAVVLVLVTINMSRRNEARKRAAARLALEVASGDAVIKAVPVRDARRSARLAGLLFLTMLLVIFWFGAGYSTMQSEICRECHADAPHMVLEEPAAHATTDCVRCHEPGGLLYSLTLGMPSRTVHLVEGMRNRLPMSEYGYTDSSACNSCHADGIETPTVNEVRGIRVSHTEPLAAGARCADCHRPNRVGVISGSYGGMAPCLRCHDGAQVSNDCTLCHVKDIGVSSVADRLPIEKSAKILVVDPNAKCYDCHDPAPCDSCHGGIRIPHPESFAGWGHAYAGVKSLWAGQNGSCRQCHNEERRSCNAERGCHGSEFPYHLQRDPNFPQTHTWARWIDMPANRVTPSNLGCATCHRGDICSACHEYRAPRPVPPQVLNPGWTPATDVDDEE